MAFQFQFRSIADISTKRTKARINLRWLKINLGLVKGPYQPGTKANRARDGGRKRAASADLMIRYPQLNATENHDASKAVKKGNFNWGRSNFRRSYEGQERPGGGQGRFCGGISGRRTARRREETVGETFIQVFLIRSRSSCTRRPLSGITGGASELRGR